MAGGGRKLWEPLSARECASGVGRRFDGVNVIVIGADVIRMLRDDALERRDNFGRAGNGLAVERPELPRMQIHHRFGEQRAGVGVVRIFARDLAHRVRVGKLLGVGHLAVGRVAHRERVDIFALGLARVRFERLRLRDCRVRHFAAIGVLGLVDIRPERKRDSPVRHRHIGIVLRGLSERVGRLVEIERVNESQSLIEELLRKRRIGFRRHRMMQIAETVENRLVHRVDRCLQVSWVSFDRAGQREQQQRGGEKNSTVHRHV